VAPSPPPMTWPPPYGQPPQLAPPPQFTRSPLFVPSPQFGRLPHATPLRESTRSQAPLAGTSSQTLQPEPLLAPPAGGALRAAQVPGSLADFGARTLSFLIDYVAPVIVLSLLLSLGAVAGSTAWRLMLAAVGYLGLLSFGIWNSGYLRGTTGRSLGHRVARMAEHRRVAR